MALASVRIDGLKQLRAALRRMAPELNKGVRTALKESAEIVAVATRERAPVRSGKLKGSVRSFASGNRAGVRVNAMKVSRHYPQGYPYPKRIEFEGGGVRAFVRPAFDEKKEEVVARMGLVLDDIRDVWDS